MTNNLMRINAEQSQGGRGGGVDLSGIVTGSLGQGCFAGEGTTSGGVAAGARVAGSIAGSRGAGRRRHRATANGSQEEEAQEVTVARLHRILARRAKMMMGEERQGRAGGRERVGGEEYGMEWRRLKLAARE